MLYGTETNKKAIPIKLLDLTIASVDIHSWNTMHPADPKAEKYKVGSMMVNAAIVFEHSVFVCAMIGENGSVPLCIVYC
jgi:hypothetical protein